jgi:ribonuclease HI
VSPWRKRIDLVKKDYQEAAQTAKNAQGIVIATSSSEKNGMVGTGGAICDTTTTGSLETAPIANYSVTLGPRNKTNPYVAELVAMAIALRNLAELLVRNRVITILSSNLSALQALNRPRQQSGQWNICQIYKTAHKLRLEGNQIFALWVPAQEEIPLKTKAKAMAKQATELGRTGQVKQGAKSTILSGEIIKLRQRVALPIGIGKHIRELDNALPGKHTQLLYNSLKRREANVLAQLRTGMSRLNGYLHQIGASETDQCTCGQAKETVKHFLFRCSQWDQQRLRLLEQTETRRGCLSFFLGGRAASEPEKQWKPNISAVQATIQYAIATGRLNPTNTDQQRQFTGSYRQLQAFADPQAVLQVPEDPQTDPQTTIQDTEDSQSSIEDTEDW